MACLDCGLPYRDFPIDTVLPDADWLLIHPEGLGGLLCAGCIVKRAAALPQTIIVHARIIPERGIDGSNPKCPKCGARTNKRTWMERLKRRDSWISTPKERS